jgi:hypothetical protein
MEQTVADHGVKCVRSKGICFPAYMPPSNINAIGQGGMPEDGFASDIEHGTGAIRANNPCLRVTACKLNGDIGGATSKI